MHRLTVEGPCNHDADGCRAGEALAGGQGGGVVVDADTADMVPRQDLVGLRARKAARESSGNLHTDKGP